MNLTLHSVEYYFCFCILKGLKLCSLKRIRLSFVLLLSSLLFNTQFCFFGSVKLFKLVSLCSFLWQVFIWLLSYTIVIKILGMKHFYLLHFMFNQIYLIELSFSVILSSNNFFDFLYQHCLNFEILFYSLNRDGAFLFILYCYFYLILLLSK